MRPLNSLSKTKLYQLIKILEDFVPIGHTILKGFPVDHFKEPMFIRVNLFERYINRIEIIIPLLKQWESNSMVEDPIGILIRACLVDVLGQFYMEEFHSKVKSCPSSEEDEYLKVATSFMADHIFSGMNYFKGLKDAGVFDLNYYKARIDEWKTLYPIYFDDQPINYDKPSNNITAKQFPSPVQLMKSIRHSELLKRHNVDQIYISYFFYSKYEHFGATTNSIQTMDSEKLFYMMMDSFTYILLACTICTGHFRHGFYRFKEEGEKMYSLREEFVKIVNISCPF